MFIKVIASQLFKRELYKNFKRYNKIIKLAKHWENVTKIKPKIMKIDQNPKFKQIFTPELKVLENLFKQNNYEIRIAGGAVRDLLMNKMPVDIDFASIATPSQMKEMFEREGIRMLNMKGEKHGTITTRINETQNFEITTLRIDMVTDGRRAEVQFTTDWQLDANRRDLTINALFLGLDGTVYDYFHGIEDLDARKVKFVGDAVQRIQEDYLRILRYFRFYGKISVEPDKHDAKILTAIRENVGGLKGISGERLWSETKKILNGNFSRELFLRMIDLGITTYFGFPEKLDLEEFNAACQRAIPMKAQPATLIAALVKNYSDILSIHDRLHFSNYDRDLALFIVKNRNEKLDFDHNQLIKHYQTLVFTYANKAKVGDLKDFICELFKYKGQEDLYREFEEWDIPKFPISGHAVLELGIKKGAKVALILNDLKSEWIKSGFELTADELKEMIPNLLDKLKK